MKEIILILMMIQTFLSGISAGMLIAGLLDLKYQDRVKGE